MSEKLDLFEITVKRGLDNYEMPLDPNAWSEFEQVLDKGRTPTLTPISGSTSSFLPKFGLAAAFLLGAVLFINQSVSDSATAIEHTESIDEQGTHSSNLAESSTAVEHDSESQNSVITADKESLAVELIKGDAEEEATKAADLFNEEAELSADEKEAMERINQRLQQKADEYTDEDGLTEDSNKKRYTTRYVGEDFNLGAIKRFSPNNDGLNDQFLPSTLEEGDLFIMTITDESGAVIFTSSEVTRPWNGTDSVGKPMQEGRYAWEVILQNDKKKEIFRGTVKLER